MNKLLLMDGHSILNRAFFGMPHMSNDKGMPTNAVFGFLTILFKLIESEKPTHIAVAFDTSAPTFRHEMYKEYKANRKPADPGFRVQVPEMKEVLKSMNILVMEKPGIEADDILGTFAKRAEKEGYDVILYSGDRDLLQIASDKILVRIPKTSKGITTEYDYHAKELMDEYGVTPEGFIDMKAVMGDSSDNYKGIDGVGQVSAQKLLSTYGSLENLYEHIDEIKGKVADKLKEGKEQAFFARTLATILTDAEVDTDFEKAKVGEMYTPEAYEKFKELGFSKFLSRFESSAVASDDRADKLIESFVEIKSSAKAEEIFEKAKKESYIGVSIQRDAKSGAFEESDGQMSLFASETNVPRCVVAIGFKDGETYFIDNKNAGSDVIKKGLIDLYNSSVMIVTDDMKSILHEAELSDEYSRDMTKRFFDVSIAAYLLNPLKSEPEVSAIAQWYISLYAPEYDLKLEKKIDISAETKPVAFLTDFKHDAYFKHMCFNAQSSLLVMDVLKEKLAETGMLSLYENIELPTAYVLYAMETVGMGLKKDELKEYGITLKESIEKLENKILEQAGETKESFNINSPKQLGELLFEKMGIEGGKKTKTGYSTSADVLEKLAADYPICKDIIEYRTLAKLNSTYVEGLSDACGDDGRIHSTFNQTVTATGRISSNDPNLQNIPTRYELGSMMRKVFVAKDGCVFCDADYSQIELRLLASFSGDDDLIKAYKENEDIHRITASKVFHIPFEEVTDELRRNAKAVNFGIVYGISSFGLSQDLSISKADAKKYIDEYFETYPSIKAYLDKAKEDAKEKGYSETYYGRRRPIPELKETNFMRKQFGERVAMNAPLQGSAADIMKIAMINVFDGLKENGLKSKLVLQVHDELIVETLIEEKEAVMKVLKEGMEGAADLPVKLEISMSTGKSWYEAK